MDPRLRIVVILIAVAGLAGSLVLLGERSGPEAPPPPPPTPVAPYALRPPGECKLPEPVEPPRWLPRSLVLPEGTYTTQVLPSIADLRKVILLARGSLDQFVQHVEAAWPPNGWEILSGEREPWEAEGTFERGDVYGQFRAQETCAQGWTALLLVFSGLA